MRRIEGSLMSLHMGKMGLKIINIFKYSIIRTI